MYVRISRRGNYHIVYGLERQQLTARLLLFRRVVYRVAIVPYCALHAHARFANLGRHAIVIVRKAQGAEIKRFREVTEILLGQAERVKHDAFAGLDLLLLLL